MFLISKCRRLETRLQTVLLRRGLVALCGGLLVCGLWGTILQTSRAQGTLRATVLNVPPVLSSPYVSDLEQNVRQGRYGVQLTYSSATGDPVQARLRLTLRHEGEQVLQTTSQPAVFRPGTYTYRTFNELPELNFEESAGDLVDQARARLGDKIARSGVLPEGQYTIEAEPLLVDPAAPVSPVPGTAVTTVRFPQPTQLVSPTDQSTVAVEMPVFSWTPVNGTAGDVFEYELLIAEVLPGQTPLQAIEANRLVTGQGPITLRQRTSFSYTQELPPLETGATYAWQVRARETTQGVPLSDDGESEIYTFTYGNVEEQAEIADISEIPLVPDFARLTQLDRLEVQKEGEAYVLDGEATLELSFADRSEPVQATVEAQNLRVQASDPTVLLGGQIQGTAPETTPGDSLQLLAPETLRWRMEEGVTLQARIKGPDGSPVGTEKQISLTRTGPRGTLTATGNPLIRFSAPPITVRVTKLRARFPQQTLRATGQVRAFGQPVGCTIDPLRLGEEAGATAFDCTMEAELPLSSGTSPPDTSSAMTVSLRTLQGTAQAQWGERGLDYDLTAEAAVQVPMANTEACGARGTLRLTPGKGARLTESASNCPVPTPRIDLGLADLMVNRLALDKLGYRPDGGWQAALTADAAVHLDVFGDAHLLEMNGLQLSTEGIEVPQVAYNGADLSHLDPFTVDGVKMALRGFSGPATTVPWTSGSDAAAGLWDFAVDLRLSFPNFGPAVPSCLRNTSIDITEARVQDGTFSASLPAQTLDDCGLSLGTDGAGPRGGQAGLTLTRLGGRIDVATEGGTPQLDPTLRLGARLKTAPPVACTANASATVDLGRSALTLDSAQGLLDGTIGGVSTQCTLSIGPLSAQMSKLTLELTPSNGQQNLFLAGTATVGVGSQTKASGPFRLNLRTGRFTELDIRITQPFDLGLPRQNPALTFRVQQAQLTPQGLTIDGRSDLVLPQTTIGATFDQVRIGLASRSIEAGTITFDRGFGFAAQVDPSTNALTLQAGSAPSAVTSSPSLYFGLSGTPRIDSTGLSLTGSQAAAKAVLDVPKLSQTTGLEAVPSDSFAVGLDPFGIRQGRVTFRRASNQTTLAFADREGLNLTPLLATAALPAKVPLPSKQVAYLRLKNTQGNLLVQTQRQPGGMVQLSTKPGQPLELVLPGLQGAQAEPPRLDVSINQLTLDAANGTYASGSITASVPQGHALRSLTRQGLPLALREVRFGTEQAGGVRRTALFLEGGLSLLGTALKPGSAQHRMTFYVESGRKAEAQVNLQNLGATVPVAGAGRAQLDVSSVTGQATVPLGGAGQPSFSFQADGAFTLESNAGNRIASSDLTFTYQRGSGSGQARLSTGPIQPRSLPSPDSIDTGPFRLAVPAVQNLSLSYDPAQQDIDFSARLDVTLGFALPDGPSFAFPLQNVTLSDQGFAIPRQSVSASSVNGLSFSRIPVGPVEIKPLALRTTVQAQFDWFGDGSFALSPKLDLAVFLPSLHGTNPGPDEGVTLSNVRVTNGSLKGSASYTPTPAARLPLGDPSAQPPALKISQITARLQGAANGAGQAVDVDLQASLVPGSGPLQVPNAQQCSSPTTFTVSLVEGPGLTGQTTNTNPCGQLTWGPVTLEMTQAALAFSFRQGTQRLVATGGATATFSNPTPNRSPVTARGQNISVDLINGQITSGALTVGTPIRVPVPLGAPDPLLAFQVGEPGTQRPVARLDKDGLTLERVSGSVDLEGGSAGVSFYDLRFSLDPAKNFKIRSGRAEISANAAVQTPFSPALDWKLVDPATPFDTTRAGARLTLDSKATLSKDGLALSGGGQAQTRIAHQNFLSLRLDFKNDFTIATQPAAEIDKGRANLYVDAAGKQSSSPIVWLDQSGVNTSLSGVAGGAMQVSLPDTLGLPTKQVAYLVLRDQQDNLLVNTSKTSSGDTRLQTTQPVKLVLPGVPSKKRSQSGVPPSVSVSLNTTVDGAGNVNVDSLGLSFQGVSDLGPDYPFALTGAYFKPKTKTFGVEAKVELPELLKKQKGSPLKVALEVDQNGFEGQVQAGTYAAQHSASAAKKAPVFTVRAPNRSDPTVTVKVRGVDFQFGSSPQDHTYKLSGDFQTPLLATRASSGSGASGSTASGKKPVLIHFSGTYAAQSQSWSLTGTASHIQGDLPMGVGTFDPNPTNGIVVSASNTTFSLALNGVFRADDVLKNFEVTVKDLKVGLKKPQGQSAQLLASVGSLGGTKTQQVDLFGDALDLSITSTDLSVQQDPLVVSASASGDLTFLRPDKTVSFSKLTVGSDGSFSVGNVQVNDLQVLGKHLMLKTLAFSQPAGTRQVQVDATAEATLPEPVTSTAQADITVKRTSGGRVKTTVNGPRFDLDNGQYKIGNNPATEFALGSFGTLDLTGLGVDLHLSDETRTPSLYAAASMYLKDNTKKRIDFGASGKVRKRPGIEVGLKKQGGSYAPEVSYDVTAQASKNDPLFEFDNGFFFRVSLTSVRLSGGTNDPMQVTLGGTAGITLPGFTGASGYSGFTVGKDGIVDKGQLSGGGSFGLLPSQPDQSNKKPILKLDVGTFTAKRNVSAGQLSVSFEDYSGQTKNGKPTGSVSSSSVTVKRYVRFANKAGSALKLSINAGKGAPTAGGVGKVLFYETKEGRSVARVKKATLGLKDKFSIEASIAYENPKRGENPKQGGFELDIAAEGSLGGGDGGSALANLGKIILIGTVDIAPNDKLSVGLFAAVESKGFIPIVPGTLDLTGIGAGFFLRADDKQMQQVTSAVNLSDKPIIQAKRKQIRTQNQALLSVMLYGKVGVIGAAGKYVMNGRVMITVSDVYTMAEVRITPKLASGGKALSLLPISQLEESFVVGVTYGGNKPSVSGAAYVQLGPVPPVATFTLQVNFFAKGENQWAVYSPGTKRANLKGPGVEVNLLSLVPLGKGTFVLCPDGFYAEFKQPIKLPPEPLFKKSPVKGTGGFDLAAWSVKGKNMGAYAKVKLMVKVPSATVGVNGKGALLKRNNTNLVYLYGGVKVPAGWIDGHMIVRNNTVNTGLGANEKYEDMVADARQKAQSIASTANQAAGQVKNLQNATSVPKASAFAASAQDLTEAGVALHREDPAGRRILAVSMGATEAPLLDATQKPLKTVADVVTASRADSSGVHQARQRMRKRLKALQQVEPRVEKRLRNANARLAKVRAQRQRQVATLASPVQRVQATMQTNAQGEVTQTPSFSVNAGQAQQNQHQISKVQQNPQQLDRRYRKALGAALSDLRQFDRIASGTSVINYRRLARGMNLTEMTSFPSVNPNLSMPGNTPGGGPRARRMPAPSVDTPPQSAASVSDVGRQYKAAVTAVHEHYAKRLDYYRTLRAEYQSARDKLHRTLGADGSKIKSHLQSAQGVDISSSMSRADFRNVEDVIAGRYKFMDQLPSGSGQSSSRAQSFRKQWSYDSSDGGLSASEADALKKTWVQSGMEMWWEIHNKGLKTLSDEVPDHLRTIASTYRSKTQELESAHEQYTQTVDRFYALKADLATLTYGMAKEYARWRRQTGLSDTTAGGTSGDTLSIDLGQTLSDLVTALEPPKVKSLTAQSQHRGYHTRTTLRWTAVPRSNSGTVREVSYDINVGGAPSIGQMNFRTIGDQQTTSITHYAVQTRYQGAGPFTTKNKRFTVGVRARGSGGNTAARTGRFQAPVHPNSTSGTPGGSVMEKDQTPPTTPRLQPDTTTDPGARAGAVYVEKGRALATGSSAFATGRPSIQFATRPVAYWAADSSTVRLVVRSEDPQSDVTKIEYAAGSQPGQTDRHGWAEVPGVRLAGGTNQGSANWRQRITIRDLDLSETQPTYLSVRTTNGAGLTSKVKTVSKPFYHDPTAPVVDTSKVAVRDTRYQQRPSNLSFDAAYGRQQTSAVQQAADWKRPPTCTASREDGVAPVVTVPARDPHSGIHDRTVRLLDRSVAPRQAFRRSSTCSSSCVTPIPDQQAYRINWGKTGASFADTLYAYVRTTNAARRSTVTKVAVSPSDRTRPTTPTIAVRPTQQGATFYLTQRASDYESGIKGYQYAVGTSPYGTDVRGWPRLGTDFSHRGSLSGFFLLNWGYTPLTVSIPSNELPSSGRYYVSVRAVNGEGDVSEPVTSGPALYDTTPPLAPTINAQYDRAGQTLTIQAQDMGDPESGLGAPPNSTSKNTVSWQVHSLIDTTRVLRGGSFRTANLGTGTFNDQARLSLASSKAAEVAAFGYRVVLTLQNRAGMTRTAATKQVVEPVARWSDAAQQWWRRSIQTLRKDGVSAQRIARLSALLDAFAPAKRTRLLRRLNQASSAAQRKQVLRKIEQGP